MKKITLLFLSFICVVFSYGQSEKDDLIKVYNNYTKHMQNQNWDSAFVYLHPVFRMAITQEGFKKGFAEALSNDVFSISSANYKVNSVSDLIYDSSAVYGLLEYEKTFTYDYNEGVSAEEIKRIHTILTQKYEVCSYDTITKSSVFIKKSVIVAVKQNKWSFILYKSKLRPYMSLWVPEDVLQKLFPAK